MAVRAIPSPGQFIQDLSEQLLHPNATSMKEATIVICPQIVEGADDQAWEENMSYTFYISNLSTRGLEVWVDRSALNVRVLTMSGIDEWWLALRFFEYAAQSADDIVINDWKIERFAVGDLRDIFEDEFIVPALNAQARELFNGAMQLGRKYELPGPMMNFYFGPWLAHRITSFIPDSEDSFVEIINFTHDLMRLVQFLAIRLDHLNCEVPEFVTLPEDGVDYVGAVIRPGAWIVPDVDFLVFSDGKKGLSALPSEDFKEQLPKYFKELDQLIWLDEHQFILCNIRQKDLLRFAKGVKELCAVLTC